MSLARITTVGLYMYDSSLFDEMVTPTKLDHDILIKNILQKSAPFELLLTDFNFLKISIGWWSAKNVDNWNSIIDAFTMDYKALYTLITEVDSSYFNFYYKGEYFDIFPKHQTVGKFSLLVEEMHRYHVNFYKNFKWKDDMYEGMELGIDLKK